MNKEYSIIINEDVKNETIYESIISVSDVRTILKALGCEEWEIKIRLGETP